MQPRVPTSEEKSELIEFLLRHDYRNDEAERQNMEGFVESAGTGEIQVGADQNPELLRPIAGIESETVGWD